MATPSSKRTHYQGYFVIFYRLCAFVIVVVNLFSSDGREKQKRRWMCWFSRIVLWWCFLLLEKEEALCNMCVGGADRG